jgi:hypothetical protein
MPPDAEPGTEGSRPPAPARWQIPFWAFQVLELGVAFLLVTQSVHVGHGGLLIAGGIALAVLALTARGPLGVFRVCGQPLHRTLVVAIALGMAACSFLPAVRPDLEGLLVIAGAVVALVLLATRTTVTGGGRRGRRRAAGGGEIIDATATVATPPDPGPTPPSPADGPDTVLRKAGRTTGAAAVVGRRAVDEYRPQVEDQVKKSLRGAGRLAGRLAGPKGGGGST